MNNVKQNLVYILQSFERVRDLIEYSKAHGYNVSVASLIDFNLIRNACESIIDAICKNPEYYREPFIRRSIDKIKLGVLCFKCHVDAFGVDYNILSDISTRIDSLHGTLEEAVGGNKRNRAGRPKANFENCINRKNLNEPDRVRTFIKRMKAALEGKNGIEAAKVIAAAMELGYIRRPSYAQITNKFGKVIARPDYGDYIPSEVSQRREDIFGDDAIDSIKRLLMI